MSRMVVKGLFKGGKSSLDSTQGCLPFFLCVFEASRRAWRVHMDFLAWLFMLFFNDCVLWYVVVIFNI